MQQLLFFTAAPYTNEERSLAQHHSVICATDPPPQKRKRMPRTRFQKKAPETKPSEPVATPAGVVEVRAPVREAVAPPAVSPDGEVLARAQAGDHHAFAQLYSLHKRRIYSLCLRMVGNVAEAEDLTQEAFLQLHRKIATFRGDSAFSTWLHRLSINVVLMHLRKKGLPLMSLDEAMEPSFDDGPGRSFGAPDLSLTGSIDRLALERAVAALPAGYRLIFVLHDVEGFEHNEIATMLDCSVGNSKSQLHKARLKLRDALRISLRQGARR
jgi:RNA polymerase sigma-70 factor (ECF subfamily)